jgi:hypothetical protein
VSNWALSRRVGPMRSSARVDDRWGWEGDGASLTDRDTLDQPFPHTEAFNPAAG